MKEPDIEGVAIHGGPESCVGVREGVGEALTGVHAGWAIEPRNPWSRGADVVSKAEGNIGGSVIASCRRTPRGQRTHACVEASCARTGRSRWSPVAVVDAPPLWFAGWHVSRCGPRGERQGGKPRVNDHGKSDGLVVPAKPPNNAADRGRRWWREGGWPRGTRPAKRAPDTAPGSGAPSALDRVRQIARKDKNARFTALLHHVDRRPAAGGLSGVEPEGRDRGRRGDVGGLRAGSGGQPPGPARAGSGRQLSREAVAKGVHPQAGRPAAAARDRRVGGQDPPARRRRRC